MSRWPTFLRNTFVSGSMAALASTSALVLAGTRETRSPVAPVNAVSHWLFGDQSFRHDDASPKYTLTGLATQYGASLFWAALLEGLVARRLGSSPAARLGEGALVSGLACFVDYRLTPERLMPGYERRLSRGALAVVYAAFAAGLAVGTALVQHRESRSG